MSAFQLKPGQDKDEAMLDACLQVLDIYGGIDRHSLPESKPKSIAGAVVTTCVRVLVVVLSIMVIVRFATYERGIVENNPVIFNPRSAPVKSNEFDRPNMDFPALKISVEHVIIMYEETDHSLRGITVNDVSGKQKGFATSRFVNTDEDRGMTLGALFGDTLLLNTPSDGTVRNDAVPGVRTTPPDNLFRRVADPTMLGQSFGPEFWRMEELH